jgi:hypothetical protein
MEHDPMAQDRRITEENRGGSSSGGDRGDRGRREHRAGA